VTVPLSSAARMPRRLRVSLLLAAALLAACGKSVAPDPSAGSPPALKVVSNRADLVSGGDALIEVVLPAGVAPSEVRMKLGTDDVTDAFALRPNGRYMGVLTGIPLGTTMLVAQFPAGAGLKLPLTNWPAAGPVFSGPQLQPWECTTEGAGLGAPQDAQCTGTTAVSYEYKDAASGQFQAYDPASPPPSSSVATTTTDAGETVRYVVRKERGTLNRGIYDFAFLHDPENDPEVTPWTPPRGWNRKFMFSYGQGCAPGYSQNSPDDPMITLGLDRGFAVGVSSMMAFGKICNSVLAAEVTMMMKERMIELLGEDRYAIGNGCSGGAEGQNTVSDLYPGLLDGTRPECTFADGWTPAMTAKADCQLLLNYFTGISPQLWASLDQQSAVVGSNVSMCYEMQALGSGPQDWDPAGSGCQIDAALIYDPATNPTGARCTLQDLNVNYVGRRADDGFANKLLDYVGIQWGLKALQDGTILAEQFVDLNEKIGSYDVDWVHVTERTSADVAGITRMYRNGQLTYGLNQRLIPSIDSRTNNQADFHGNIQREIMRNRVLRSVGNLDSQVYWLEATEAPFGLPTPPQSALTLTKVDEWLANIEADTSGDPLPVKVARNRPADVVDGACYDAGQPLPREQCDAIYTHQLLPRLVAGAPNTADVLKCQLKPLARDSADYAGITFTDAQWARLQAAFPQGVCDWNKPGVGQQPPVGDWLTFRNGPDGVPLPSPPVAAPL
jgi:hypothetical protein